ncbi:hypothetical protein E3P99_00718 [Wallemia hederae]|uniref:Aminotransferase class I/classII large domain-containing protein n=1 Tax=Wallemia hederae TaxID=1540922 RepID=A0A4T0FYH8_9BASI|nr:hypothetical protein E3P99_00718 [Wallemia hederae]
MENQINISEFRKQCEEFYAGGSKHTAMDMDKLFIHASPALRAELSSVQDAVRREYHARVERDRETLLKELRATVKPSRAHCKDIVAALKSFISKHHTTNNPGIEIFLIALYNLIRLQRSHPNRLTWRVDNAVFTENGDKEYATDAYKLVVQHFSCSCTVVDSRNASYILPASLSNSQLSTIARTFPASVKRSRRIVAAIAGDVESGKSDKLATGSVYISEERREEQKEGRVLARREEKGMIRRLQSDVVNPITTNNLIDFSSNDYLSLSRNASLTHRVKVRLAESEVMGSGGSRLLDGDSTFYRSLERRLASFYNPHNDALLFNSGYDANYSIFSTLPDSTDVIIYDELIHASVHDGMRASRVSRERVWAMQHSNVSHLRELLSKAAQVTPNGSVFVAVEAVYSMDGDLCPLAEIADAMQLHTNTHLVVDEAHSTGYIGRGRGLTSALGLDKHVAVKLNTFGKALCAAGAVVTCKSSVRHYLVNYARPLIFSTSMTHANLHILDIVHEVLASGGLDDDINRLVRNSRYLRSTLKRINRLDQVGMTDAADNTPIIPIVTPHSKELAQYLQKSGFCVRHITFPTVPLGSDRVSLSTFVIDIAISHREISRMNHNHGDMDMPMPAMCKMDMLWNWDIQDRCVVFSSWHITSTASALFSLVVIAFLGVTFEWLKYRMRKLDTSIANSLAIAYNIHASYQKTAGAGVDVDAGDVHVDVESSDDNRRALQTPAKLLVPKHQQIQRSLLYAASAALSFFLMLIFMTYNAFLIAAVIVGAGTGHYVFHREIEVAPSNESSSSLGCHL